MNKFFELRAIIGMNPFEEFGGRKSMLWIEAQNLRSVVAPLRRVGPGIPVKGHHSPGGQRFLKPGLTLQECGLMVTALREKRSKNECAERDGKDARLGTQNAMLDRDSGIAEIADTKCGHPDQCKRNYEGGRSGEDGATAGRNPQ